MFVSIQWGEIAAFCDVHSQKRHLYWVRAAWQKSMLPRLLLPDIFLFHYCVNGPEEWAGSHIAIDIPLQLKEPHLRFLPYTIGLELVKWLSSWLSSNCELSSGNFSSSLEKLCDIQKHVTLKDHLQRLSSHPITVPSGALVCMFCSLPPHVYLCVCIYIIYILKVSGREGLRRGLHGESAFVCLHGDPCTANKSTT
jgi:hypothetical protein